MHKLKFMFLIESNIKNPDFTPIPQSGSYDEIAVFGGGTNISEGNRITANPDIAYGAFTVGFQF